MKHLKSFNEGKKEDREATINGLKADKDKLFDEMDLHKTVITKHQREYDEAIKKIHRIEDKIEDLKKAYKKDKKNDKKIRSIHKRVV